MSTRQNRNNQKRGSQVQYIAPISNNFVSAKPPVISTPAPAPVILPLISVQEIPLPDSIPEVTQIVDTTMEVAQEKPKWMGIKKKLSAKEKRIRNNRKLRKLLAPKNALMAFNELLQSNKPAEFKLESNGQNYVAEVVFKNIKYEGYGSSKNMAKNDACEKAVRDLVIAKLSKLQSQEAIQSADNSNSDVEMNDDSNADDDGVPMLQLASFALHKLFAEWSAEGFEIPSTKLSPKPNADQVMECAETASKVGQPKRTILRTEVPANANLMHPTMLLSAMRAGIHYDDLGSTGAVGNVVQNCGVTVDGQQFLGSGRSKKLARKAAAIKACNTLFGTTYTEEN